MKARHLQANSTSKLITILLIAVLTCGLFVAAPRMAYAANTDITGTATESIAAYQTRIQNAINASSSGDTVTVLGSAVDQATPLSFNIKSGVTLIWKRSWGSPVSVSNLINITGGGTFEVAEGGFLGIAPGNNGTVINAGADSSVVVSGGTVQAGNGRAINAYSVRVSGGAVSSSGGETYVIVSRTVEVRGGRVEAKGYGGAISAMTVEVSGGTVAATFDTVINGTGAGVIRVSGGSIETQGVAISAIETTGSVQVSGGSILSATGHAIGTEAAGSVVEVSGGTVRSTGGHAIFATGLGSTVTVSGGTVRGEGNYGATIYARKITVSNGRVEAAGDAEAIMAVGRSAAVTISGGVVCATTGFAIYTDDVDSPVNISGGFVFAYGRQIIQGSGAAKEVIIMFADAPSITATGIVCAWNKDANHSEYVEGTTDDLTVMPTGRAVWGIQSSQYGIAYSNGSNTGFFPINGVHVSAATFAVTVSSGTASITTAAAGETVNITAGTAPEGKVFDRWTSPDGVTFADATSANTSFVMPDKPVSISATYKDAPSGGSDSQNNGSIGNNGNNGGNGSGSNGSGSNGDMTWLWVALGALVVLVAAGIISLVVIRKKKANKPSKTADADQSTVKENENDTIKQEETLQK